MSLRCAAELIWTHALNHPRSTALVTAGRTVTYQELIRRAVELGLQFESLLSGQRNHPIAICTDKTLELIVGALAAWRVGCPYLPIDPAEPVKRLQHILCAAEVPIIAAAAAANLTGIASGGWKRIVLEEPSVLTVATEALPVEWTVQPDDLAYVICTSGSTGLPKAVAATQGNLANFISWFQTNFEIQPRDRVTQLMPLTFDVSVAEIWPNLSAGATIYAPDRSICLEPRRLRDYVVEHGITMCEVPALVAEQLIRLDWPCNTKLRTLQTGGEMLRTFPPPTLPFNLVNNYGPTECTIDVLSGVVLPDDDSQGDYPSIGRPAQGAEVFLLDAALNPVADGENGEIYVGGPGVTAGYIGRPDLTAERFIENPFHLGGARLYRTGDIGRKLSNGKYQFCGRVDKQIKLRGYRIEPSEVVAALLRHTAISAAVVTTIGEGINKQLVAYLVLRSDITTLDLRSHLGLYLPQCMIPDCFVRIEKVPITARGKTDIHALPLPDYVNSLEAGDPFLEPQNEIQNEICLIFSRILNKNGFSVRDRLLSLGVNSLIAAQAVAEIESSFGVDLPLRSIFDAGTVFELATEVENRIVLAMKIPSRRDETNRGWDYK